MNPGRLETSGMPFFVNLQSSITTICQDSRFTLFGHSPITVKVRFGPTVTATFGLSDLRVPILIEVASNSVIGGPKAIYPSRFGILGNALVHCGKTFLGPLKEGKT